MSLQFISRLFSVKSAAGVEITTQENGSHLINIVIAEVKKEKVSVVKKIYGLKDIQQLKENIPSGMPVALVLNGKGILHKSVALNEKTVLGSLIPGVKTADFYVQDIGLSSVKDIAITRKNFVDDILQAIEISSLKVLDIYLGFSSLFTILSLLPDTVIETTHYRISINNAAISSYNRNLGDSANDIVKPEISIASEYISENLVIPFSAAIAILSVLQIHDESAIPGKVLSNSRQAAENKKLQLYSWILLCSTLLILLVNSFVFSHYYKKNEEILSVYQSGLQQSEKNDSALAILKRKKIFLDDIGWTTSNKKLSFYADRIAAAMPYEITLTGMNLFPLQQSRQSTSREGLSFLDHTITINGECDDPSVLYDWLGRMQLISGVSNAKVNNYFFNKETQTGSFIVELVLK